MTSAGYALLGVHANPVRISGYRALLGWRIDGIHCWCDTLSSMRSFSMSSRGCPVLLRNHICDRWPCNSIGIGSRFEFGHLTRERVPRGTPALTAPDPPAGSVTFTCCERFSKPSLRRALRAKRNNWPAASPGAPARRTGASPRNETCQTTRLPPSTGASGAHNPPADLRNTPVSSPRGESALSARNALVL